MDRSSTEATRPSGRGLDWLNFFVAAVQTGFGAFATVYLVKNLWPPQAIGLALTIATITSLFSQIPAGAALDSIRDKRRAVLLGIVGVGLAALLLCMTAARPAVYLALAIQGLASSLIGPGIAAISLSLVGQAALSERIGRNARFASIGNGLAAGTMGIAGSYLPGPRCRCPRHAATSAIDLSSNPLTCVDMISVTRAPERRGIDLPRMRTSIGRYAGATTPPLGRSEFLPCGADWPGSKIWGQDGCGWDI
jgi:Major Facilitator Superfamily